MYLANRKKSHSPIASLSKHVAQLLIVYPLIGSDQSIHQFFTCQIFPTYVNNNL